MKILVVNTGSSTIKYKLYDMAGRRALASGLAERIGDGESRLTHRLYPPGGAAESSSAVVPMADHRAGMMRIVERLTCGPGAVVGAGERIDAVGHRVVHGGEDFRAPAVVDEEVLDAIRRNAPLAPLHNPPNLAGIEVARSVFPAALHVAVFDTAFHQSLPEEAFLYAVPLELYERERVRRYGFHGTSHAFVSEAAAAWLGRPPGETDLITLHLGNGASMAAVKGGRCIDTTMGMTPLAGLVMGTRCGDVDPALPLFLSRRLAMTTERIDELLNEESGLRGLCGESDMREVLAMAGQGDPGAATALKVYAYRVRKYIGAFFAALGRLDAIVFTAGVGENSPEVRERCCRGLEGLGIAIDEERNSSGEGGVRDVGREGAAVRVLVVPTDEELRIAEETAKVAAAAGLGD